jgi:hypothetical protein
MEDLWLPNSFQRHLQSLKAELRVKAVRGLLAVGVAFSAGVHMSGAEIHDHHLLNEPLLERDVGDIGGPHLIHSHDRAVRSTRQANRSDGAPGTVVRGFW